MQELPVLTNILIFTFLGSILSLCGGIILLFKRGIVDSASHLLISFAAGTLLGTAFLDLLPEAIEESSAPEQVFMYCLGGFLFFFVLERFLHWMHHHPHEHVAGEKPTVALINFGDSIHNFIDGVAIAATFLVSIPLGVVTAIAVGAHEIPQEIGDFAVMLKRGVSPKKVLFFNFLSTAASLFGALLTYYLGSKIQEPLYIFVAITAGFFMYISASDLIPEIHENNRRSFAFLETLMLLIGVASIYLLVSLLEH